MLTPEDRNLLRELARRVKDIAERPEMAQRRALWRQHNDLIPGRPLILIFPEGSWRELLPETSLCCTDKAARSVEADLRRRIYPFEHFASDNVVEKELTVSEVIHDSGWGLKPQWQWSPNPLGARRFDPVIREPADLKKLRHPQFEYDERATQEQFTLWQDALGDILDVRVRGYHRIFFNLMAVYTSLRGLEEAMLDMVEQPNMLHDAMAFLAEGYAGRTRQLVQQNLLSLNNDNSYHASGGNGFTTQLPAPGFDPARVRPSDLWAAAEAQELAQVSPEMHEEFALAYEKKLLAPFGLSGYGCCEDLTRKLVYVFGVPHLRRISISPFAGVDRCAEKLKGRYIFSWKPHPSHLVGDYSPARIRTYIQHTVDVAREHGCVLEMILKDTHTCENHPERFDEWTRIARSIVDGG